MKTYYIRKPQTERKTLITIIVDPVIDGQEIHRKLLELAQITDLFFVFTEKSKIQCKKFANLYNAAYYSYADNKQTKTEYIWEAIEYVKELGENYAGYCYVTGNITQLDNDDLMKMSSSLIETSILKLMPLSWEDYQDIYKLPEIKLPKWMNLKLVENIMRTKENNYKMFSSHTTQDPVIFLRPVTIIRLQEYFNSYPKYQDTFKYSTFEEFIASSIYQVCPETLLNRTLHETTTQTTRK